MVSVTSDITASTSFQAPPPRAKADPSPASDSFASLVDSNTTAAANSNDRAQDRVQDRAQDPVPAPQPPASEKRATPSRRDDATAAEKAQPRDTRADRTERNDVATSDVAGADQAGAEEPAEAGSTRPAKTRAAGKDGELKFGEASISDEADATDFIDTQVATDPSDTAVATAIATVITVAAIATDVQAPVKTATNAGSDGGPLAIAAAAIATSTAVTEAATAPVPAPAAAPTGGDAAKTAAADAKPVEVTAAGTEAIAKAAADAEPTDTAAATAIALTVPTPRPAAPKTSAAVRSAAPGAGDVAASSDETDISAGTNEVPTANATTAPAASDTEQAAVAKPAVKTALAETIVKPESTGAQTPSATAVHLHPASQRDAAPGQTSTQTSLIQAATSFQPLVQAPVMSSQPSLTVTAATPSAPVPLSGLAMEIAASVRSGNSRFEIRLDPAELGRIDVRIDVDRNGQVTSHLTVEKPETLSMLRQDAPQLQRALTDAGLSTGDSGLQFSLRDQSSSGQNGNQSNPNAQRLILTEEETVPAAVAGSYGRMMGASGGVDIRV